MKVKITPSFLKGEVTVPASKSMAHRILIASFLSGERVEIEGRLQGDDVAATCACLKAIAPYVYKNEALSNVLDTINAAFCSKYERYGCEDSLVLNVSESGSTLRFLLPVVCALGVSAAFDGSGRLKDRPVSELLQTLCEHGAAIENADGSAGEKRLPFKVSGKLTSGKYRIAGNVSSQYISGLLFALPLLEGDSEIEICGSLVSESYIGLTLSVLEQFGVKIEKSAEGFKVAGNQKYVAPKKARVEGDWSSAAFLMGAAAICGEVSVKGLDVNSRQGDKIILDVLSQAGADITLLPDGVKVGRSALRAVSYCATDCPDTVPLVSTVLAFAHGLSRITGVDRLRSKESDRLFAVTETLKRFGIRTEYADDELKIYGGNPKGCKASGFSDHRIAMSCIVGALAADGESTVDGVECISKSYPDFIKDAVLLGGRISEE